MNTVKNNSFNPIKEIKADRLTTKILTYFLTFIIFQSSFSNTYTTGVFLPATNNYLANNIWNQNNFEPWNSIAETTPKNNNDKILSNTTALTLKKGVSNVYFQSDIKMGIIGTNSEYPIDNPMDNFFKVQLPEISNGNQKIILKYDVYGTYEDGVALSINGSHATGGYFLKKNNEWRSHQEELSQNNLRAGENVLFFSTPKGSDAVYKIKNLSIAILEEPIAEKNNLITVNPSTTTLIKDGNILIKGYVKNLKNQDIKVFTSDLQSLRVENGVFEGVIKLNGLQKKNNKITLVVSDDNAIIAQTDYQLGTIEKADSYLLPEAFSVVKSDDFLPFEKKEISLKKVKLSIVDSALTEKKNISIEELRYVDKAPMNVGLTNVTPHENSYRFLPDGTQFQKEVEITLPYDSTAVPRGKSLNDIRTYYFDVTMKSWVALPLVSINRKEQTITSYTTHFTDYINGVIMTPESPETSAFTPTTMNNIKAANPAAGLSLINIPQASQKGEANISYPINIPAGRKGMQPSLSLNYSNDGGNGWLGLGWNLATPAITIDTRWGSPVFDSTNETELYSMNGEMLMYPKDYLPHRHRDTIDAQGAAIYNTTLQLRTANVTGTAKIFTPRKQGSFAKIERIGNNTTNYFWKVTQTDGTVYWYGGYNTAVVDNAVIRQLSGTTGNIVHWALYRVEDSFGNTITYDYLNERAMPTIFTDSNTNLRGGVIFNVRNIYYAGYKTALTGNYRITFENQLNIKSDPSFSARLGVKQIEPYLLKNIKVYHNVNPTAGLTTGWTLVKNYELLYKPNSGQPTVEGLAGGHFGKNLLEKVKEYYGATSTFFNEHKFDYYDNIVNREPLFGSLQSINVPDNVDSKSLLDMADLLNSSRIESSQNKEANYNVRPAVGIGFPFGKQKPNILLTVGAPFGEASFNGKGIYSMIDVDGDGLEDIVFRAKGGGISYSKHLVINGVHSFGIIHTLNSVNTYFESSGVTKTNFGSSWDFMCLKFYAGIKRFKTSSSTKIYFEDCNGDGNVDLVSNGVVAFNIPNANGDLDFSSSSKNSENMLITASAKTNTPVTEPEAETETKADYDVVRVWVAPKDGTITITDNIQLLNFVAGNSAQYAIEIANPLINSGAPYRLYYKLLNTATATAISITTNGGNNPPLGIVNSTPLIVKKGQKIYFRKINDIVHTEEVIKSDPKITYTNTIPDPVASLDELTLAAAVNSYSTNFLLSSDKGVEIPYLGSVNIDWAPISVTSQSDNVEFKITRVFVSDQTGEEQALVIFKKLVGFGSSTTIVNPAANEIPGGINLANYVLPTPGVPGKYYFKFEVTAPSQVKWKTLEWKPTIVYTGDPALVPANIPNPNTLYAVPKYTVFKNNFVRRLTTVSGWNVPSQSLTFKALPNIQGASNSNFAASDNGKFLFIVKKGNQLISKYEISIVNGTIQTPITELYGLPAGIFTGNLVTNSSNINYSVGYYVDGEENQKLFEKFKQAVGPLQTAYLSYGSSPGSSSNSYYLEVDSFYNSYPYLGSMLGNWGQFFYNDKFDTSNMPSDAISKLINSAFIDNPAVNAPGLSTLVPNPANCQSTTPVSAQEQCVINQTNIPIPAAGTINNTNVESTVTAIQTYLNNANISPVTPLFFPIALRSSTRGNSEEKWIGIFNTQYSAKDAVKAGGFAGSFFDTLITETADMANVFQADLSTGMFGVSKEHRSAARSYSAGWADSVLNFNVGLMIGTSTSEYSKNIQDFTDVNGDRYPDIVTSDYFQKSNMTGGHNPFVLHAANSPLSGAVTASNSTISYLSANLGYPVAGKKIYLKDNKGNNVCIDDQPVVSGETSSTIGVGINANLSGQDRDIHFYADLNGDGLPENITENNGYIYELNLGNSFLTDPNNTFSSLQGPMSKPAAFNGSFFYDYSVTDLIGNAGAFDFNVGAGTSSNTSSTKRQLQDVNGDGLVDLLILADNTNITTVYYNYGNGFSPVGETLEFQSGSSLILSNNSSTNNFVLYGNASLFSNILACCPFFPFLYFKFGVTVSGGVGVSINGTDKSLRDFNGDGFVDYVEKDGNDLKVAYSKIGKTNMLKSVTNPLGGVFTVDYDVIAPTYTNPNAKWVMTTVQTDDKYSFQNDGNDVTKKSFVYENGYYDRREREFYGFETIKTRDINLAENNEELSPAIYRTSVAKYHNRSYFLNGLLKESFVCQGTDETRIFSKSKKEYVIKSLLSNGSKINLAAANLPVTFDVGGTEGRKQAIVLLTKTISEFYELQDDPLISESTMEYDNKGRLIKYYDNGNTADTADNSRSEIDYHDTTALALLNIISIPKEIRVFDNSGNMKRKRMTENVSQTTGAIGTVSVWLGGTDYAKTDRTYGLVGNTMSVTYPVNNTGQRIKYTYTYDTEQSKNIIEILDVFGYKTTFDYDPSTDVLNSQVDITGRTIYYTYDVFGRMLTVKGPNEALAGKPYTIKFIYVNKYADAALNGISTSDLPAANFVPFAITKHYDVQNPTNDIETITFADGFGRLVQTKKDILLNTGTTAAPTYSEKMSYSGMTTLDCFGRAVKQFHPYYEDKANALSYKMAIPAVDPPYVTMGYDEMDRIVSSTDESSNETEIDFYLDSDIDIDTGNLCQITKSTVSQNGSQSIVSETFTNAKGQVVGTRNEGPNSSFLITKFVYNSIGEQTSFSDALGTTTSYQYDFLGRKTKITQPDSGVTNFAYDPAGNLITSQNANLLAQSKFVNYTYNYNQLLTVTYPNNIDGTVNIANVSYVYGTTGNSKGRVVKQTDATGIQEFVYGNMGEITENKRTIKMFSLPDRIFTTKYTYDSWNRIQTLTYPDAEIVTYKYDLGGNLNKITSTISGTTTDYVSKLEYDHYGQKTYMKYGNNTENFYGYDPITRRMDNIKAVASDSQVMFNNTYLYDNVGNIINISNSAAHNSTNNLGGIYSNTFSYDMLNRLTGSTGTWKVSKKSYSTTMTYNKAHQIVSKNQQILNNGVADYSSANLNYTLNPAHHKVISVLDQSTGINSTLTYDANGNMKDRTENTGVIINYFWDEENRLRANYYDGWMQYNLYDAGGERIIKMSGQSVGVFVNGSPSGVNPAVVMDQHTVYPSGLLTYNQDLQYIKHYYIGSQRIISRIGEGVFTTFTASGSGLKASGTGINKNELGQAQLLDLNTMAKMAGVGSAKLADVKDTETNERDEETSSQKSGDASALPVVISLISYFHPNHLGTATFMSDSYGTLSEFFLNLPFGETLVDQRSGTNVVNNRYKFTGKELDEGTGLYYYGARYYDPKLSLWLSVDPLAEKFPNVSPYAYCFDNPINLIDPTGMAPNDWVKNNKTGAYEWKNEVTSASNTPKGYTYIGKEDSSIIYDLFGQSSFKASDWDLGIISAEDFDNPYSAKGSAAYHMNAESTLSVSFLADVKTKYDSSGGIKSKDFLGVNVFASVSGETNAPYPNIGALSLRGDSMTLQGNQMGVFKPSPYGNISIGGDVPTLNYQNYWNAGSIQGNYGKSFNLNFSFKGVYFDTDSLRSLTFPAAFGIPLENSTNLNLTVPFNNIGAGNYINKL